MITDRIGRHEVLPSINHRNINFREKKNSQVIMLCYSLYSIKLSLKDGGSLWDSFVSTASLLQTCFVALELRQLIHLNKNLQSSSAKYNRSLFDKNL